MSLLLFRVPKPSSLCCVLSNVDIITHRFVHHHLDDPEVFHGRHKVGNRHPTPKKFRPLRHAKFIKVTLPDFQKNRERERLPPNELRSEIIKEGLPPYLAEFPHRARTWRERQILMETIGDTIDRYEPEESESSSYLMRGKKTAKQTLKKPKEVYVQRRALKAIRAKEGFEEFSQHTFPDEAEEVFIKAHEAMERRDEDGLRKYVTDSVFWGMWSCVIRGSIRWKWVEKIDASRVVRVRHEQFPMNSGNLFAQVTVRFHTKQKLAVYDQFGRLVVGSETVAVPVLEYMVFENHLSNPYGGWRICDKIVPHVYPRQPFMPTFPKPISRNEEEDDLTPEERENLIARQKSKPITSVY